MQQESFFSKHFESSTYKEDADTLIIVIDVFGGPEHIRAAIMCKQLYTKTRLKRLPVISRKHFRQTRTNYLFGISNTNLQHGCSNTSA
jgi:hypothetical protein